MFIIRVEPSAAVKPSRDTTPVTVVTVVSARGAPLPSVT